MNDLEKEPLKREKSCGCVIIKNNKVLLVYEKTAQYWGFPKGHMESGENEIETAQREIKEEVGLEVEIVTQKRYVLKYTIDNEIYKTTVLYVAKPKNEQIKIQESEIEKAKWYSFKEALDILSFDNLKEILKNVIEDI